jgi:hypothetical protein
MNLVRRRSQAVAPAKAGAQFFFLEIMGSRLRGNDLLAAIQSFAK